MGTRKPACSLGLYGGFFALLLFVYSIQDVKEWTLPIIH